MKMQKEGEKTSVAAGGETAAKELAYQKQHVEEKLEEISRGGGRRKTAAAAAEKRQDQRKQQQEERHTLLCPLFLLTINFILQVILCFLKL